MKQLLIILLFLSNGLILFGQNCHEFRGRGKHEAGLRTGEWVFTNNCGDYILHANYMISKGGDGAIYYYMNTLRQGKIKVAEILLENKGVKNLTLYFYRRDLNGIDLDLNPSQRLHLTISNSPGLGNHQKRMEDLIIRWRNFGNLVATGIDYRRYYTFRKIFHGTGWSHGYFHYGINNPLFVDIFEYLVNSLLYEAFRDSLDGAISIEDGNNILTFHNQFRDRELGPGFYRVYYSARPEYLYEETIFVRGHPTSIRDKFRGNHNYRLTFYHLNGEIESRGKVRDNQFHRKWKYFDENGRKVRTVRFRKGEVRGERNH